MQVYEMGNLGEMPKTVVNRARAIINDMREHGVISQSPETRIAVEKVYEVFRMVLANVFPERGIILEASRQGIRGLGFSPFTTPVTVVAEQSVDSDDSDLTDDSQM